MDFQYHSLPNLFAQLGLPVGDTSIEQFIASHRPLPATLPLAEVVDELNLRFHS